MERESETTQIAGLGLEICSAEWEFQCEGPWQDRVDRRKLRAMAYPWRISQTGEYALLSREVVLPPDWKPPFTLTFFSSDDYLVDDFRPQEGYGFSGDIYHDIASRRS